MDNDNNRQVTCYESILNCCGSCTGCLRAWLPCCCCWCPYPYVQISQGFVGLKERFGKFIEQVGPGLHEINPCTEVIDLQRQLILTKDNITVDIDTSVYFRTVDAKVAYYTVANTYNSVTQVTYATLRTICGEHTLQDLLQKRQQIADIIEEYVQQKVKKWGMIIEDIGVYVEQIFIKDMQIAKDLQRDLSMASKADRLGKAKIISAKADVVSAKLMHQAAQILNSKAAMQIRYLQILQKISGGSGSKLMFMPLNSDEYQS